MSTKPCERQRDATNFTLCACTWIMVRIPLQLIPTLLHLIKFNRNSASYGYGALRTDRSPVTALRGTPAL